ncbi:MAG: SDR family oxidoreductase [Rhodobacteraceae bacterium]|nr:SDR family oxidoreductase [Paracoccaceae bacterium]
MIGSIAGKSVIVTGAANGVGLAIARRFVEAGANVLLADMNEEKLAAEVKLLADEKGNAEAFSGDLREKLTVNNLLAATIDAFDRVDILVNASRQVMTGDPLETKDDCFDQMMHQNVTVNMRLCQAVARRMVHQAGKSDGDSGGAIINITSIAAVQTQRNLVSFSVASAALNQLTRSLAVSFGAQGIRVNAVALGSIMSGSLLSALNNDDTLRDRVIAATPLGRIGEASEAAEAVLFLASPAAGFITGQVLAVDGGRSLLDRMDQASH